ncbi:MAG: SMC family ATPase, partial [Candidatus Heimdallarchaeota archaeon]|nr:SMC family ATPase [Candidatus Heimdallarchaeota archaeon]
MILKTLRLRNFRIFSHETIEFPDGLIGVIGLNGVGKSTIFEAIAWALYGSVAAKTATDHIKHIYAEPSATCSVELTFEFGGNTYHVLREMRGKSLAPVATVTMNQQQVATGAGSVSTYIQKT